MFLIPGGTEIFNPHFWPPEPSVSSRVSPEHCYPSLRHLLIAFCKYFEFGKSNFAPDTWKSAKADQCNSYCAPCRDDSDLSNYQQTKLAIFFKLEGHRPQPPEDCEGSFDSFWCAYVSFLLWEYWRQEQTHVFWGQGGQNTRFSVLVLACTQTFLKISNLGFVRSDTLKVG